MNGTKSLWQDIRIKNNKVDFIDKTVFIKGGFFA
jgi:hypothetical protein